MAFKTNDQQRAEQAENEQTTTAAPSVIAGAGEEYVWIAYRQLRHTPLNVRRTRGTDPESDAELKASIKAHGILQNMVVHPMKSRGKTPLYGVAAGGRRFDRAGELVAEGHYTKDTQFLCLVERDPAKAIAKSMAENSAREPMTVADTVAAFAQMVEAGAALDDIALCFGLSRRTVERRVALASMSPALLKLFRDGAITIDQMEALALTADHATQDRVWKTTPTYQRHARNLRSLVLGESVDAASSALVKYVTLAAYEADGGPVVRDLFADDDAGYVTDLERLQRLALAKMEPKLAKLRAEGWGWVEVMFTFGWSEQRQFSEAPKGRRAPTASEQAAIEAQERAKAEAEAALEALTQDPNCDEDEAERLECAIDEAGSKLYKLTSKLETITPDIKALAGVIVSIDDSGKLVSHRGQVKPEHRKSAAKAAALTRGEEGGSAPAQAVATVSEALCRKLTSHRTIALQNVLADNHHVALAALAHPLAHKLLIQGYSQLHSALDIQISDCDGDMTRNADDIESSRAWSDMAARLKAWRERLPADAAALLPWLIQQSDATLVELLALCAALSVNAIRSREGNSPADQLATAVALDMADWWQPTAASYLSQVPKSRAAEAVAEALSPDACAGFDKMKKGQAVSEAEALLSGRRWLPAVLRTPAA